MKPSNLPAKKLPLDQYPIVDNLSDPDNIDLINKHLQEYSFFYIKDEYNIKKSIDNILDNLPNATDVYYGEEPGSGKPDNFHSPYAKFMPDDPLNNTVIKQYNNFFNKLLNNISLALGQKESYFTDISKNTNSGMYIYQREQEYMKFISNIGKEDISITTHVDSSLITAIVAIDGFEGFFRKENKWISLPIINNYILIQAGSVLEKLTNNKIKSHIHHVRGFDSSKAIFWGNLKPV